MRTFIRISRLFLFGIITAIVSVGTGFLAVVGSMDPKPLVLADVPEISLIALGVGGIIVCGNIWAASLKPPPNTPLTRRVEEAYKEEQ